MSLQIVYGRSGSGKTTYIFEDISKNINNGRKKYVITPEQFSFSAEKELLTSLEKAYGIVAVINAEVLTFNRMAHRVSNEVGHITKMPISNSGKAMLVYSILANKKNELKFLGKSDDNTSVMLTQITELKKHSISLENLSNVMNNIQDKNRYLYEKLNDIYTVYSKYESKIADNYIDENDSLTLLYEQLDSTDMFDNTDIYIDEFVGFTKQEYLIIEKLMEVANNVMITVCSDELNTKLNQDTDIFYSSKQTAEKIINIAKENNINIEQNIYLDELKRFKSDELIHMEQNIFKVPYDVYDKEVLNIKLFLENNPYSEIENVAKQIIKLVRDNNYRYKEISIITPDIDKYSFLCKSIFGRYNIPIYIDEKGDLSQNILVKYLISLLNIFAKNWSTDSVLQYIKSGFIDLDINDIFMIEKYAVKWSIRGNTWYKDNWNFYDNIDTNKINNIRIKIVNPLLKLKENLSGTKTAKQISENIYNFLIENKIDKILEDKINNLKNIGELYIASEYETSWKIIMQVLDEMVSVFNDDKITFENYMQILKIGLGNSNLGTIPIMQDQVILGDVDRSRNNKIKVVFIIGLNDGNFPKANMPEGFLDDENRNFLKTYGIELAKTTIENIYEDNFNIYKAFTTAEDKLFLSYVSSNLDGKSLRQSILVSKIKKIFPKILQESDVVKEKVEIISKESCFEELLQNLRKLKSGEEVNKIWTNIYDIFYNDSEYKLKLENAVNMLDYSNRPEKISKENIEKMYPKTMQTSISKLEKYRSCPFSYYVKYGLNLDDRDVFKVETLDTGSFMHDVINSFFDNLGRNNINIKLIEDGQLEDIVSEIIDEKLKLNKNYIFEVTPKYKNLAKRLKKVITTSIKYIVLTLKQSSFSVLGHEIEFADNGKYKPIKISTDSGKIVEITGKIDRIDVAKNKNGNYVRIIDYKSSIKDIDLNKVVAGLQIQLLTYLNEMCKVEDFIPAGVLYFSLLDPNVKSDKHLSNEEIESKIREQFKMNGLILADVDVIKLMDNNVGNQSDSSLIIPAKIKKDGEISQSKQVINAKQFDNLQKYTNKILKQISDEILSGNIDIKPYYNSKNSKSKTYCSYCKYKTICRFDVNNKDNKYNYIGTFSKDEIFEKIEKRD